MTILKSNNSSEKLAESSKTVKLTVTVYYRKGTQVTISTREQYTGRARRVQGVSFQMSSLGVVPRTALNSPIRET